MSVIIEFNNNLIIMIKKKNDTQRLWLELECLSEHKNICKLENSSVGKHTIAKNKVTTVHVLQKQIDLI